MYLCGEGLVFAHKIMRFRDICARFVTPFEGGKIYELGGKDSLRRTDKQLGAGEFKIN